MCIWRNGVVILIPATPPPPLPTNPWAKEYNTKNVRNTETDPGILILVLTQIVGLKLTNTTLTGKIIIWSTVENNSVLWLKMKSAEQREIFNR